MLFPLLQYSKTPLLLFRNIQGQVNVGLFQLYPASLSCHHSRHVEYLQQISCCFQQWDSAITSTIYASVASSTVIEAYVVHSWGCLSRNSTTKIPELSPSWCSISQTVWTNALVNSGGFPVHSTIDCSHSSLRTHAVRYTTKWWPFTTVWIYSHPTACCFFYVLLPVLLTSFKCAFWVIVLVAALVVLRCTNWWLRSCCVPMSDVFDEAHANWFDLDQLSPVWVGCVSMICWSGIGEEDDNEKKWEVLRVISLASCQNGIRSSQHVTYTQDESYCV